MKKIVKKRTPQYKRHFYRLNVKNLAVLIIFLFFLRSFAALLHRNISYKK
jgi:hypothetical protein